jgi:hypothetical protein
MTIPTGGDTEVLKRAVFDGLSNTTQTVITVGTNKIVTVLNIIINNQQTAICTLDIQLSPAGSGTHKYFYSTSGIGSLDTFIWNDRLVLHPADVLKVMSSSTNFDVCLNYIEQDWT